eukprot:tig00021036_g17335.t1
MQRWTRALLWAAALAALLSVAAAGCTGNGCSEEAASALCDKDNAGLPTGCPNMAPQNVHPQDGDKTCQRVKDGDGKVLPNMVRCRFRLYGSKTNPKYEPFDKNQAPAGTPNTPAALKTLEFKFRRECKKSDPIVLRTGTLPAIAGTNVAAGTALAGTGATYELKVTAVGDDDTTEYDITVTSELFRDAKLKVFFRASFKTEAEAPAPSDFSLFEFANPVVPCGVSDCTCPQDVTVDGSTGLGAPGLVVDLAQPSPSPVALSFDTATDPDTLLGVEAVAKFAPPSVAAGKTAFKDDSNAYYTLELRSVTPADASAQPCPSSIVPDPALNLSPRKQYASSTTEVRMNLCPGRKYEYVLSACYKTPDSCADNDATDDVTVPAVPPRRDPEEAEAQINSGDFSVVPGTFAESPFGFPAKIDQFTPFWDGGSAITVYRVKVALVAATNPPDCPLPELTGAWTEITAGNELSLGSLCPGYQYNVWLDACHLEGGVQTCASGSGLEYGPVATTMPVVAPICKSVLSGALVQPSLSGISFKADGADTDVDTVMDEFAWQQYGYKTAILSFTDMYSGGAAWSNMTFFIRRYIMGQNGATATPYDTIVRGPTTKYGITVNSALVNNLNPSHCYGYTMMCCAQVPGEAARCCQTGASATWFMPSNARYNKDYCNGVNPGGQMAVGLRSIAGAGSEGTLIMGGSSTPASANAAANVQPAAASAANNNLILAVAIAVPAGVAVIAVVAVASVAYIVKSRNVGAMTASEIDAIRSAARAAAYATSSPKHGYAPLPASRSASFRVGPAEVPMAPLNAPFQMQPGSFGEINAAAARARAGRSFSCVAGPELGALATMRETTEVQDFGAPTARPSGSSAPHIDA